jgi:hypothetical protein
MTWGTRDTADPHVGVLLNEMQRSHTRHISAALCTRYVLMGHPQVALMEDETKVMQVTCCLVANGCWAYRIYCQVA